MIPKECKRLAEVDFPIADVSRHAAREKSIRHGHPSMVHLWWARRPLASSRAVLLTLLWPDPCDALCPAAFKGEAKKRLRELPGCNPGTTDRDLRNALLRFIADFSNWDNAAQRTYLDVSRALVKAAYESDDGGVYEPPLVVDPFAGGGSIPLEALRLGCEAFASDLNPVASLILKVMLEDIPRIGPELTGELRKVVTEIKAQAEKELAEFYPKDPDGVTPIAYLWARTVRCESPNCGAEIPLVRSFWLCKKTNRRRAFRHRIIRPAGKPPRVELEIFEPRSEKDVHPGTVTRAKATCACCGTVLSPERVRAQLSAQGGGADVIFDSLGCRTGGARLLAVVGIDEHASSGRVYRAAEAKDYTPVRSARGALERLSGLQLSNGLPVIPNEPVIQARVAKNSPFRFHLYGCDVFGNLCTARQKLGLLTLARQIREVQASLPVREVLALIHDKVASRNSSLCSWRYQADQEKVEHMFVRQALSLEWDFAEAVPLSNSTGSFSDAAAGVGLALDSIAGAIALPGQAIASDAAASPLSDAGAAIWFTDPPYYDAVPYSDLSDYFYVWLKRALPDHPLLRDRDDPSNPLTPKRHEARMDEARDFDGSPKDAAFFEEAMARAFAEGRRVLRDDGIGSVVFAHKTTEGWEALLSGIIRGGWTVTGSWPIATEMATRLRARESAALATSVHLICRPRLDHSPVGDWADVLRELPTRVADWMERLQGEGVRGADLVFACIGPALEIFSRFEKVETAEGREVELPEYLAKVWEVVGRSALGQVLGTAEARARNGAVGAVEEDARLTALFLWTLQSTDSGGGQEHEGEDYEPTEGDEEEEGTLPGKPKGFTLVFDVVRRFAQPLGIELPKWEGRVIDINKGIVRLLPIAERAKKLFGEDGASAVATRLEQTVTLGSNPLQGMLFPEMEMAPRPRGARDRAKPLRRGISDESLAAVPEATTLDRVHAAMLLQSAGRTKALRALLKAEQDRGADFLRLANALSALYPTGSEEKRLVDAMLLAVPR